jgi:hypothetical protein
MLVDSIIFYPLVLWFMFKPYSSMPEMIEALWKNYVFGLCSSSNVVSFLEILDDGQVQKTRFFQIQHTIIRTLQNWFVQLV